MSAPYRLSHAVSTRVGLPVLPFGLNDATERARAAAFEELYKTTFPRIYAFLRCQVSTVETAQELVGRVFLKAYNHRLKAPASDIGRMQWIFRIAHTTLIDYWRVEKRREAVSVPLDELAELPTESENPEAAYARKERSAQVIRGMSTLSDHDRMMLALKFSAQRTNREISGILGLSEGAVCMRLLRALRRLREQLQVMGWP